jgi:hypothetical protein
MTNRSQNPNPSTDRRFAIIARPVCSTPKCRRHAHTDALCVPCSNRNH